MMIDGVDNGVDQYPNDIKPKYLNKTGIGDRIHHLNPGWNDVNQDENIQFQKACEVMNEELLS